MSKYKDLTGQKFGRLTVIKKIKTKWLVVWLCQCECGNQTKVPTAADLKEGLLKAVVVQGRFTHGFVKRSRWQT